MTDPTFDFFYTGLLPHLSPDSCQSNQTKTEEEDGGWLGDGLCIRTVYSSLSAIPAKDGWKDGHFTIGVNVSSIIPPCIREDKSPWHVEPLLPGVSDNTGMDRHLGARRYVLEKIVHRIPSLDCRGGFIPVIE